MNAREFLSQAYQIDKRIAAKTDEIAQIRARLTKATAQLTGMPRGGNSDWTDVDIKVMELEAQLKADLKALCSIKARVAEAISTVGDESYRTLLQLRYQDYYSFERIAVEMNYSWRHTLRLHKAALKAVRVPEGGDKNGQ